MAKRETESAFQVRSYGRPQFPRVLTPETLMSDDALRQLFAYHVVHKTVLIALIASHPEPKFLLKGLRHYAEAPEIALLYSNLPEESRAQAAAEMRSFLEIAERYAQT